MYPSNVEKFHEVIISVHADVSLFSPKLNLRPDDQTKLTEASKHLLHKLQEKLVKKDEMKHKPKEPRRRFD